MTPLRGWTLDRHGFDILRWDPRAVAIKVVLRLITLAAARLRTSCTAIEQLIATPNDSSTVALEAFPHRIAMPAIDYLASLLCAWRP